MPSTRHLPRATADRPGPRLDGTYTWRDPARVTPARRAELEAHDRKFAVPGAPDAGAALGGDRRGQELKARAAWRRAEFARLRAEGATVAAAAEAVGWSAKTGQRREREQQRKAAAR